MDELLVEIAGLVTAIRAPSATLATVRERCRGYAVKDCPPDLVLTIHPSSASPPPAPFPTAPVRADVVAHGTGFHITRPGLVVDLALGAPAAATCRCWPQPLEVDNALKLCLAALFPPRGVLLLHASAVRYRGRGFVFTGPSGSGKSTIVELLTGVSDTVSLGDDVVAVILAPQGPRVVSTPFRGKPEDVPPGAAPLARLYLLEPAPARSAPQHLVRLLRNTLVHAGTPELGEAVLRNGMRLVASTETRALFHPTRAELLRELDR